MSQERTEQRDPAKDRDIIGAALPGPWVIDDYQIVTEQYVILQAPDAAPGAFEFIVAARTAWPAALDEIDRLNEVNAELTAKVQERDKYIKSLTARYIALGADLDKRDKEIERLRAALASAKDKFESIGRSDRKGQIELLALRGYEESGAALKGAE